MKANVFHIVTGHLATLKDESSGKLAIADLMFFYGLPACIAGAAVYACVTVGNDVYSLAVSVFAIFAALLLSVQIALFGIFQRNWSAPEDAKLEKVWKEKLAERRELLVELNTNISYLTVTCCVFIIILVIFYVMRLWPQFELAVFCFLFFHFALTLFMVIKRAHALFHKEYEQG